MVQVPFPLFPGIDYCPLGVAGYVGHVGTDLVSFFLPDISHKDV